MLNLKGKICQEIAPEDDMYAGNLDHYFGVGESALKNIIISLDLAKKEKSLSILDMPSGCGRVLRYLVDRFPEAEITACDLEKNMVDFCVKTFNVKGIYSEKEVRDFNLGKKFDLIWCGSLFTHLDKQRWESLLEFFYRHLNEKGVLIFTTHGRYAAHLMNDKVYDYGIPKEEISLVIDSLKKDGFGYTNYPNSNEYGISISSFPWIYNEIEKFKDLRVVLFSEKAWDNHQDVIACIKESQKQ